MIEFDSFEFVGDFFYQKKTKVPLNMTGLTLLKGKNFDASSEGAATSNGTGKSRLPQILEGFIFNKNPRGNFKKTILSHFKGTLLFKDSKGNRWSFTFDPREAVGAWTVIKNDIPIKLSHKPTDNQDKLQEALGLSRDDWNSYVCINQNSLHTLMRGKPTEKRNYLESFFGIDSFYASKFDIYKNEWKKVKDDIEVLKEDRIRLSAIRDAQRELPGGEWIDIQLAGCDEALSLLKHNISEITERQSAVQKSLDIWSQYHALFTQVQGYDTNQIRQEYQDLLTEKSELDKKARGRLQLETFLRVKLNPHQNRKPEGKLKEPNEPKPTHKDIADKSLILNQMREKLRLKKQIIPITQELEDLRLRIEKIPSKSDLESLIALMAKERLDAEEHLRLLQKGGDVCPTCHQPLTFILDGMSLAERKTALTQKIRECTEHSKEYEIQRLMHSDFSKIQQRLSLLKEQFDRFPLFGVKLSEAELELENMNANLAAWKSYEDERDSITKWQTTYDLLMMEAKGLGYPEIMDIDVSMDLKRISERLVQVTDLKKLFDRFDSLTDDVLHLDPIASLDEQAERDRDDMQTLLSRIESLNEFKGVLRTQKENIITLNKQAQVLEEKIKDLKVTESECKILELMNSFYSPTGFKIYELKKRCQKLIERANYWSNLFFQEPLVWSLSEDIDSIDFFIKPTHHDDTDPYPITLMSSGEFNRASRVLLFSQLELIPPNKRTNLLILDEIEGHLDEAGMTAFCEIVLPKLKETFPDKTIVVISHLGSLAQAGVLDHIWLAERRDRKTTLTVYPDYKRKIV